MHFTPKDWIFAYFKFFGVGKLILAGLIFASVIDTAKKFIGGVVDTAEQLFAGVVYTGNNINSRISPRIFEKIQNSPNGILMGLGDTDLWKKPEARNSRVSSVTRFFASGFFHESVSHQPQSIPLGPFQIFSKIRGDIRK